MSEIELLPCPFCGGKAADIFTVGDISEKRRYTVKCRICFSGVGHYADTKRAIEMWNTRKPMERIVEQLEKQKITAFLTIANTGDKSLDLAYKKVGDCLDDAIAMVRRGGAE